MIISPSGNFYGSEKVFYDYISNTKLECNIVVNKKGSLLVKLRELRKDLPIKSYSNTYLLYAKLGMLLLMGRIKTIYVNEGGHSRYINVLSKLFPFAKFIIHVRMIEDALPSRWPRILPKNMAVLSISKYLQRHIPVDNRMIYDPYPFGNDEIDNRRKMILDGRFKVGIIGRVSVTKGIRNILKLLCALETKQKIDFFEFIFFGDITGDAIESGLLDELQKFRNVYFRGFISDKYSIYNDIDCVLHGSTNEALGRIFLEAIDFEIPFVGIDEAGIGEVASVVNLTHLLVENRESSIGDLMLHKLDYIKENYNRIVDDMALAKVKAREIFNIENYTKLIDSLIME